MASFVDMTGSAASPQKRPSLTSADLEQPQIPKEAPEERRHYLEVENLNEVPLWLAPCHLVAALFQCMQALFLFAFASKVDVKWLVYTNYPGPDSLLEESDYARPDPTLVSSYPVAWYSGAFVLLSAIDHLICIMPVFRKKYEYLIQRNQCPSRWAEYSLSNPLMKVLIAQVAGVTDLHIMVLIFFINHSAIYFPLLHEKINAKARADGYTQNWAPFFCGCVPHLASWGVIWSYFFTGIARRGEPPAFVSTICLTLFFLDLLFPLCFVLQWNKVGIFSNYLFGEFGFIMLSFTAKTFLAWITLGGALRFTMD